MESGIIFVQHSLLGQVGQAGFGDATGEFLLQAGASCELLLEVDLTPSSQHLCTLLTCLKPIAEFCRLKISTNCNLYLMPLLHF